MNILIMGLGNVGCAEMLLQYKSANDSGSMRVFGYDTSETSIDVLEHTSYGSLFDGLSTSAEDFHNSDIDIVIVCVSTTITNKRIDVADIHSGLYHLKLKDSAIVVVKSAVPVGFSEKLASHLGRRVFYIPEFMREGVTACDDITNTKLVIIGCSEDTTPPNILCEFLKMIYPHASEFKHLTSRDAEFIKLANNTFLANRVSLFNEFNNLAHELKLSPDVLQTLCDNNPIIGNVYNTPSFGFGGYCLPKDVHELSYTTGIPTPIINNLSASNDSSIEIHTTNIITKIMKLPKDSSVVFYNVGYKEGSYSSTNSPSVRIMQGVLKYMLDCDRLPLYYSGQHVLGLIDSSVKYISKESILDSDFVICEFPDEYIRSRDCALYSPTGFKQGVR